MKSITKFLLVLFLFASCKKNNNNSDNGSNNNSGDTTETGAIKDTMNLTLANIPGLTVGIKFSCCLRAIWGEGLIDEYYLVSNTSSQRDTIGFINHSFSTIYNSFNTQFTGNDIRYFSIISNPNISNVDSISGIPSLDFRKNLSINYLSFPNNRTEKINLENCNQLTKLYCYNNKLDSINLSTNYNLKYLDCNQNNLISIDLKNDSLINYIDCSFNKIENLSLLNHTNIYSLNCSNNNLTSLLISSKSTTNTSYNIDCSNNKLSASAINRIFDSLPIKYTSSSIKIKNNPGTFSCNLLKANNKGWSVITN